MGIVYNDPKNITFASAWLYVSQVGVTRPASTVAYGGDWGAGWRNVGMTTDPVKFTYTPTKTDKVVQQALSKVGVSRTMEKATIVTALAESTLENLQLAYGGIYTQIEQAVGVQGKEVLTVGGSSCISTLQWGIEAYWEKDCGERLPFRLFCIGEAEVGGELAFDKSNILKYPLTIDVSADLAQPINKQMFEIYRVLGNAL